jgi:transposase
MREQLRRAGTPGPPVIGIDEVSIKKGHVYRIVVSDLSRHRPIWFGGTDRSEASMDQFYAWLGPRKTGRLRLAVMDMWKPFRLSTAHHAPQASILFDKFHVLRHLGDALDQVRKREYARVSGRQRRFIKGQKYTLLAHRENLTLDGRQALKTLLAANKRLNTAYAQGVVRAALGLPPRRLGLSLLRALAGGSQVATSGALREVRGSCCSNAFTVCQARCSSLATSRIGEARQRRPT